MSRFWKKTSEGCKPKVKKNAELMTLQNYSKQFDKIAKKAKTDLKKTKKVKGEKLDELMTNSQMRMIEMMKIYRSVKQTNQQLQQQQLQQQQQQQLVSQKATDTKESETKESIPSEKKDPAPSEENDESKIEKLTETTEDDSDMRPADRENDIVTNLETIPSISERQALVKPTLRARFVNGFRKVLISVRRPFSLCFGSQQ